MVKLVGIGSPSMYEAFPLASFGTLPVVTLKRASRANPDNTKAVRRSWSSGVRTPMAKAQLAGATPNEICEAVRWYTVMPEVSMRYQVSQGVQLLSHETALLSPPRDHAIEEVEEHAEWHEAECEP